MNTRKTIADRRIDIRKYPNRRYYDATRRQHITIEDIHGLVREGYDVVVTDSKGGEDITAKVLAQIILEHDSPKLKVFPVELLHHVIRTSEPLFREFVEKYFSQALLVFLQSQQQFREYLRDSLDLGSPLERTNRWMRMMMGPFAPPFLAPSDRAEGPDGPSDDSAQERQDEEEPPDLRQMVQQLSRQVSALQKKLDQASSQAHDR
jgi:polyhydroxyalkanoate synthesis repressor PhaR